MRSSFKEGESDKGLAEKLEVFNNLFRCNDSLFRNTGLRVDNITYNISRYEGFHAARDVIDKPVEIFKGIDDI